jgi:hypothetical protein
MIMGRTLDQVMAGLSPARRKKIEARIAEIIAEEMSLRDLRKAMGKTQASLARKLGIGQEGVSRLEKRADVLLSTLNAHIEALGGTLHIVAELPDRAPVRISDLGIIAPEGKAGKGKSPRPTTRRGTGRRSGPPR